MKGAATLISLLIAAIAGGLLLALLRPDPPSKEASREQSGLSAESYVEETLGLRFKAAPEVRRVPMDIWLDRVRENLAAQFGPGGLARRSRALELMGFHEFSRQPMEKGLTALLSIGLRGWLDEREGDLLIANDLTKTRMRTVSSFTAFSPACFCTSMPR